VVGTVIHRIASVAVAIALVVLVLAAIVIVATALVVLVLAAIVIVVLALVAIAVRPAWELARSNVAAIAQIVSTGQVVAEVGIVTYSSSFLDIGTVKAVIQFLSCRTLFLKSIALQEL